MYHSTADNRLQATDRMGYNLRMSERIPDWLLQSTKKANSYRDRTPPVPGSSVLPEWLSGAPREPVAPSPEGKALLFTQFETITPRLLELVCEGYTLNNAVKELPIKIDAGAYIRWLRKQPRLYEMYKEAKEIRTEAWAGEIIRHAEGKDEDGNETLADTARSRLIVDTFKWLMQADNRKQYGDTKTIEMNTTISITAALAEAQGRVIEAQLIEDDEVDVIEATDYKRIAAPVDPYEDDE